MSPDTATPEQTFARLLTANQARIYAFVFTLVAEPHRAHDAFQETNRVLWEAASEFDAERPFLPWAFAIARNQVRAARQRGRRDRLTFADDVVDRIADRMSVRAEQLDERQVALAECLQRLTEHQRQLIQRRYAGDESVQDIAASQQRSTNVVAVTLFRVRQALADCIRGTLREGTGMSAERRQELQRLFTALETEGLDAADQQRLDELLADDDLLDAALDQLEVDALLHWHHGAVPAATAPTAATPTASAPRPAPIRRWPVTLAALAAALLIALTVWYWPTELGQFGSRDPQPLVELADTWQVQPTGDADFEILAPRHLQLNRGELLVRSVRAPAGDITVTTESGDARATGTEFFVGCHESNPTDKQSKTMNTRLTRILVLSGTVTLSNALGAATASSNEFVVAPQDQPPTKIVASSSGDFGFDLYRTLAANQQGKNMFFSPYSIATALTMTAEGARGLTAEEMGKVLRWPEGARRVGDDAQKIPYALARIHCGYAALNRLFNAGQTAEQQELRQRANALLTQMAEVQKRVNAARAARDRRAQRQARIGMRDLGKQYDTIAGGLKSYKLSIANALWGQKTYPFAKDFLATVDASYDTGAFIPADFAGNPAKEVERINAWVEKRTEGRIKNLAYEPVINVNTRLALVNAIYFKAQWLTPFDQGRTKPGDFIAADGAKVKAQMMRHYGLEECRYGAFNADGSCFASPKLIDRGQKEGLYPAAGGFQVLELPYQGRDLAMVLLLPDDPNGLAKLEAQLTAAKVDAWLGKLEQRKTGVRMPRFEAEMAFMLNDALKELGMGRAFNPSTGADGADFSGMTQSTDPTEQLYIQAVLHKAFIAVDEKGTEAAAATMVAMGRKGAPRRLPFVPYFNAERPFVYMIRDLRTGTILFLGRVTTP